MENPISLIILIPALIGGIAALVWSADRFVDGAAAIADHFGLSPLIIGLTIVSIGTSAPEIFVSANAALEQSSGIAVGNALGSNLANIGLVLGITALITPLAINPRMVKRELPIMLAVALAAGVVLFDGYLGRLESLFLLAGLISFIGYLTLTTIRGSKQSTELPEVDVKIVPMPISKAALITLAGLVVLVLSSRMLVWSASELATRFGVSDLVVGVTVVAIGTSLPELAASLSGALKGHSDLAIGNVLGSNIFNFLAVLPVAGVIYPMPIEDVSFIRDFGTVLFISLLFGGACLWKMRREPAGHLGRPMGITLLAIYVGYFYWLLG